MYISRQSSPLNSTNMAFGWITGTSNATCPEPSWIFLTLVYWKLNGPSSSPSNCTSQKLRSPWYNSSCSHPYICKPSPRPKYFKTWSTSIFTPPSSTVLKSSEASLPPSDPLWSALHAFREESFRSSNQHITLFKILLWLRTNSVTGPVPVSAWAGHHLPLQQHLVPYISSLQPLQAAVLVMLPYHRASALAVPSAQYTFPSSPG